MADFSKIRTLRKEKGLTLMKLSKMAELSFGYIADLEKGIKKNPSVQTLESIAKALNVDSIKDLINDD